MHFNEILTGLPEANGTQGSDLNPTRGTGG